MMITSNVNEGSHCAAHAISHDLFYRLVWDYSKGIQWKQKIMGYVSNYEDYYCYRSYWCKKGV